MLSSLHVIPPFLVIAAQPRSGPFRVELENKVTQGLRGQHARGKNAARHAVAHPMRASPAILRARARALSPGKPREAAGSGPGKIGRAGRVLKKELETTRRASSVRSCVASLACAHQRPTHEPNQRSPKKQRSRTHILGRTGWLCTSASSLHVIPPFLVIAAQPRSGPFRVELENKVTQGLRGQHARGKNAARHAVAHPMRASPAILRARARSLPIPHCVPAWAGGAAQQRQWREKPQSEI